MAEEASASETLHGLSTAEAQARLAREGPNELPRGDRRTLWRIVFEVLREPMLALLLAAGAIYLALGNREEAIILLVFASLSVVITVVQEARTERVLEALRDLASPRALVIRDGVQKRIAGRDVVRGDLVLLAEGDRVPADALVLSARDLTIDESLLTGESVPVRKIAAAAGAAPTPPQPGGEDQAFVFSGTLTVRGQGLCRVVATGAQSAIGRIGVALRYVEPEPPPLQGETRRLVKVFAAIGAGISLLAVILYGTMRGGWLDALLGGIALGMAMLPEEFPVVLTVFMAMGAWRIARAQVLTRRAVAIEALGAATILCTDKTGTLTQNRMALAQLRLVGGDVLRLGEGDKEWAGAFAELLTIGLLASTRHAFDPMERALQETGRARLADAGRFDRWTLVKEYGLRPDLLAITQVWREPERPGEAIVAAKGAPEAIADLCRLDDGQRAALMRAVEAMAAEGLRVLGVARGVHGGSDVPDTPRAFAFDCLGLLGFADPLRASVPAAVAECQAAGIRIAMITGDYAATARAIAAQAGIGRGDVVTGEALARMDEAALAAAVHRVSIYARIAPEQKLRIVNALKGAGEIVAMTGDGVNDAPSLKAAHIGIAMGGRGTDVAREASAIVLLDDDFGSIAKAIRLGRRIYDNLRKSMGFILAVHIPIAGLALMPLVFGLPILFGPVHIAFLEMVIDPVCSLVFEAEREEADVMRRPPRPPAEPLFSAALIGWGIVQGVLAFVVVAGIFLAALARGMPAEEVRALSFFSLVLAIVGLIFVNRSFSASLWTALRRPNIHLAIALAVVALVLGLSLTWPVLRDLFGFGPLHADDLAVTLAAGLAVLVLLDLVKFAWWRRRRPR
jgi:Ca2+-transporting ATPase